MSYDLDRPGFEFWAGAINLSLLKSVQKGAETRLVSFSVGTVGSFFFEIKATLPPSSREVKHEWNYTSCHPYAFVGCIGTSLCFCIRYLPINKTICNSDINISSVVCTLY